MSVRRPATRLVTLDRALERLPLFRLSDSAADEGALQWVPEPGLRWRVLPAPGDRLPGTFDQDVWVGLLHRWAEAGRPDDGAITFRLHAFLRSLGRKADGRTYEQLRASLARLERTTLESIGTYRAATPDAPGVPAAPVDTSFTLLASVVIERRRQEDQDQLALFPAFTANEPGDARVILAPPVRANLAAGFVAELSWASYQKLGSPVARRLYRLLAALGPELPGRAGRWPLEQWAEQLPLAQRYPSHLQRVLQPAHEMLIAAGVVRTAAVVQEGRERWVEYAW
jgi:plasmid replication initiation protein